MDTSKAQELAQKLRKRHSDEERYYGGRINPLLNEAADELLRLDKDNGNKQEVAARQLPSISTLTTPASSDVVVRPARSDQEVLDQTERLALYFLAHFLDGKLAPGASIRTTTSGRGQLCWEAARQAQILLTDTDPLDAADNLEKEHD